MNMLPRIRVIALLMLLAGASLGVFASRALQATSAPESLDADQRTPKRIERLVDRYVNEYALDPKQEEGVRQALLRYDRQVRNKLLELRQQHAHEFRRLFDETDASIAEILGERDGER